MIKFTFIKPKKVIQSITKTNNHFFAGLQSFLAPLLLLASRLWIANVFFKSGRNKLANMDTTIYLFEYEYMVAGVSPVFAAYSSTIFELICPIFLAIGLLSRFAVLPLIGITLVIQFLVVQNTEHYYWLFLLITILIYGSGKLSADRFLKLK